MFNITEKHRWIFLASGILIVLSIAALIVSIVQFGLPPLVGAEAARAAGLAILAAVVFIPAFVWWSSRRVPHAFRYGVCAIAGIACSLLFTCGFYALMTVLAGWKMDALFLTATLIVISFLAQDVIAVFDRIRENVARHRAEPYEMVVNRSILETLSGLLATRLCAVLVLVAIILLGGTTIKPFVATMLAGMIGETYTAVFIAAPLLVVWEKAAV